MKLLVIQSDSGPDYLADLLLAELIHSGNHEITTNHLPQYLFDDYPDQHKIYGMGYTVFGKLPNNKKKNIIVLPLECLLLKLAEKYFYKVIYSSIWRQNILIQNALQTYEKDKIIVIDGEDHTNVLNIASSVLYFKRELISPFSENCLPISFTFPSYHQPKMIDIDKKYFLAPCVPSVRKSYVFNTENLYYQQYAESYFGLTTKKGGWDCMRHYEIIRVGCIPYFPDIVNKPISTMSNYPILLQYKANKLFEICIQNPALIENERNDDLINLKLEFSAWLSDSGTSHIYQSLI